jgi:hypothetical protein
MSESYYHPIIIMIDKDLAQETGKPNNTNLEVRITGSVNSGI